MGLESVELVLATEDAFGIEITDAEAEKIFTAGDLCDCVIAKLRQSGQTDAVRDGHAVWMRLRGVISEQLGVEIRRILKSSRFVEDLRVD